MDRERLQKILNEKCPYIASQFDFHVFLENYSKVVYIPFLFLLHLKRNGLQGGFEREFNIRLKKQASVEQIENNGYLFVKALSESLIDLCTNHPVWYSWNVEQEKSNLKNSNLSESNAYLYVRGHNVFDLIAYIGSLLCSGCELIFKQDILLNVLESGCEDLQRVDRDLRTILL